MAKKAISSSGKRFLLNDVYKGAGKEAKRLIKQEVKRLNKMKK